MKIVIAPDSFKGSATAIQVAQAIADGLLAVDRGLEIVQVPMADGGEGTVEAMVSNADGQWVTATVEGPLGGKVEARYGWLKEQRTAVVEMAAASGLPLLQDDQRDPHRASTYGTGQLILDVLERGARTLILGLGGSATVDGGAGCLQALGMRFMDKKGRVMERVAGGDLGRIAEIDPRELDKRLQRLTIQVASDVTNPLLGEQGAVRVFGPQKGLGEDQLAPFEAAMTRFADLAEKTSGRQVREEPGTGAAGGFGFGLRAFLEAQLCNGFELIATRTGLAETIDGADLVITGEGKIDAQSLFGKVPVGVARIARARGIPVVAFSGLIEDPGQRARIEGLTLLWPIVDRPMTVEEAMGGVAELLSRAARRLLETVHLGRLIQTE